MQKIRWGMLSTARIAVEKMIPAIQSGQYGRVSAIASRTAQNARSAAQRWGIPRAYDSYEKLLNDPDIDAVYIALPNHLHVPWSLRALKKRKCRRL